jgi:hypothetical protein
MPSKRVSLKGKGADLFFGGDPPAESDATATEGAEAAAMPLSEVGHDEAAAATAPTAAPTTSPPKRSSARRNPSQPRHRRDDRETRGDMSPATGDVAVAETPAPATASLASETAGAETVERIRKTVKEIGREVAFTRLSPAEKGRLADIVYTYKRQGVKTSENEINRIAINLMLRDYELYGEQSVLARVLAALQA